MADQPSIPRSQRGNRRRGLEGALAPPGTLVRLQVSSTQPRIRRYVNRLDRLFSYEPVDTQVVGVTGGRPQFSEAKTGLTVEKAGMAKAITRALASTNRRRPVELIVSTVEPKVTPANYGPVVIIHRGANGLSLFDGPTLVRRFGVATGSSQYPTPLGTYSIATKQMNPWWIPPPDSEWAKGAKPIPPGPGNPLGTRWMGLTRTARRDSRDARRGLDRLLGLPRVHPHARAGRGVALRAGERRHDGHDRPRLEHESPSQQPSFQRQAGTLPARMAPIHGLTAPPAGTPRTSQTEPAATG